MSASLYQYVYLIIVIIMTFNVMSSYSLIGNENISNTSSRNKSVIIIALLFSLVIGLRPISWTFVDMWNYHIDYLRISVNPFLIYGDTENFIFDKIFKWFAVNGIPEEFFYLFISLIYFCCIAWACVKIFPRNALLAFVVYLGAFSTFSYGTNGIKAGAAASIFLLALAYRKNKLLAIFFLWMSLGFHHSMLAPIVAYAMACFYKNQKAYLWAWYVSLLLAAAHVTFFMSFFSGFIDEHGASYLLANKINKEVSGFRPDFILYSAVPVFIGYNLIKKKYVESDFYNFLWSTYTMTNSVFLLCTYGSYINRIAYLSWLMYPIVLLYPFVNIECTNQPNTLQRYLKYVVYGHLTFTAFMTFIYYV